MSTGALTICITWSSLVIILIIQDVLDIILAEKWYQLSLPFLYTGLYEIKKILPACKQLNVFHVSGKATSKCNSILHYSSPPEGTNLMFRGHQVMAVHASRWIYTVYEWQTVEIILSDWLTSEAFHPSQQPQVWKLAIFYSWDPFHKGYMSSSLISFTNFLHYYYNSNNPIR